MDQISITVAGAIGLALVTAIVTLFKLYVTSRDNKDKDKACSDRVKALENKVEDIYKMLLKKSDLEIVKTEQREQRAWERALELSRILEQASEITKHAIRIIRRHESDAELTPVPRSRNLAPTDDTSPTPSYEKPMSDETSRFVKDGKQH